MFAMFAVGARLCKRQKGNPKAGKIVLKKDVKVPSTLININAHFTSTSTTSKPLLHRLINPAELDAGVLAGLREYLVTAQTITATSQAKPHS